MNKRNEAEKEKEEEEELHFDFNFDDLESDSVDNEDILRPYQWGTNIQFVNINVNHLSLQERNNNNSHFKQLHLCQNVFSEKEANIQYDEEKKICYTDDEDDELTEYADYEPVEQREISTFHPQLYDICSLESFPLNILDLNNNSLSLSYDALEYLHCNLPDFTEFNNYLSLILTECGYKLRVANYIATKDNMSLMIANGGSKILHFMAYICNPIRDYGTYPLLMSTFPSHEYYHCDTDYILMQQREVNGFANGKWIKVGDLAQSICFSRHSHLNDIIIAVSPQADKLCDIFSNRFGSKYVIGVQYNERNKKPFSCSQTGIFLKYFYSSILNQECVDRAFKLAKTSTLLHAPLQTNNGNANINIMLRTRNENNSARYVIFPHLQLQSAAVHTTQYNSETNIQNLQNLSYNLIKTRPFIGRRKNVVDLIAAINKHKICIVNGKENNGKSCLIQNTVRHLVQHCYFDSCFLIDCDKNHTNKTFIDYLCHEIDIEMNLNDLFSDLKMKICVIILNINKWKNETEIYQFIDIFIQKSNGKSKCILSTNKNIKNNNKNIAMLHIDKLHRKYISQIFLLLISNKYKMNDVINHNKLHQIFNGSARITKCVAEFVNSINSKYNHQLSLNEIATKYPQSPFAKHYTFQSKLTVCIPVPCPHPTQHKKHKIHSELVDEYDSFPDIDIQHKNNNQSLDFDGLSFTTKAPSQSTHTHCEYDHELPALNTLRLSPKDSDEPIIDMHAAKTNGYNSGSGSSDDTPSPLRMHNYHIPKQHIYNYYEYEYDYGNISEEEITHKTHRKDNSVVVLFGKHRSNISFSNQQLNDVTDSLSLKLLNQDSQSEAEEDDNDGLGNVVNLNVIAHLSRIKDSDARAIWVQAGHGSDDYNQYGYLYKLYPFLIKKFQFMTRTKRNHPCLLELEYYFLLFGGKYLRNTNVSVIHVTKYDKFYSWFVFMCLVVADLRMIYDNYNLNCLFYDKQTCHQILKIKEVGIFMLAFTNKINYLAIKYKKKNRSNDVCTILLKRHSKDLYSVNGSNEKVSLFHIIRPRAYLQCLYTKNALIPKKKVF